MTVLEEIEKRALQLPVWERALLAEHMLESLDSLTQEEHERLWLDESKSRYDAYLRSETTARPAEEVFADLYARQKK